MAKRFSFAPYDRKHLQNLVRRANNIRALLDEAMREGTRIGTATGFCDPEGEFMFDKFPGVKKRVDALFRELHDNLVVQVSEGNREEWLLSAAKNDALVDSLFGHVAKYGKVAREWKEPNLSALERFTERKERGMTLSGRVWNLTNQFKGELEMALELGLGEGKSADDLSRAVRGFLNEPHKLFRRVRNEKGVLRLSKAAAAYHPGQGGQGVYRSSYKNALRLTATENNMAYRTADHERWQRMDFVIGIEIKLSNNHPVNDICNELIGVYPKTFKFVGWHPFCRCIAVPKLADEDDFINRMNARMDGEDAPEGEFSGKVTEYPKGFRDFVANNAAKIEAADARHTPYFVRDNREAIDKMIKKAAEPRKLTPQEIAVTRRANRDAEGIQENWSRRRKENARKEQERYHLTDEQKDKLNEIHSRLDDALFFDPKDEFNEIYKELRAELDAIRKGQMCELTFSPEQKKVFAEMEKEWGIKRGRPMTASEADLTHANPDWKPNTPTAINCQTCAPCYVLRSQGFDITAGPNTKGSLSEELSLAWYRKHDLSYYKTNSYNCWKNPDGSEVTPLKVGEWMATKKYKAMNTKRYIEVFQEYCTEPGIYEVCTVWKGSGGHATILQKFPDGTLAYIEPQHSTIVKIPIEELAERMSAKGRAAILRVDDKVFDMKYASIFRHK